MTNSNMTPTGGNGNGPANPIAYKGVRVMTTERLAKEFSAEPARIHQNYAANRVRFTEQVHFFKVTGADLRDLKNYLAQNEVVEIGARAPHAYLWTERGAFAHAKILGTDEAWGVHERLVDTYFAVKEGRIEPPAKTEAPRISGALLRELLSFPGKLRAAFPSLSEAALQAAFSKLSGKVLGEPLLPAPNLGGRMFTAAEIAEAHGITAQRLGRITNEAGIPRDDTTGKNLLGKSEHSDKQVPHWHWNEHGKSLVDAAITIWKQGQLLPPANSNTKKPDAGSGVA